MKLSKTTIALLTSSFVFISNTDVALAKNYKQEQVPSFKDRIVCPKPLILRDGPYLGAQVGYDSYRVRQSLNHPGISSIIGTGAFNTTGWLGGLFLGYGKASPEGFYLGGEIFANGSNASSNYSTSDTLGTYSSKFKVNSSYGVALLPGVKLTDATLGYLRLGYNWVNLKLTENMSGSASVKKSNTSNGFNFGVGMESLLIDNWSLRGEFSHTWYNSFNTSYGTSVNPSDNQYTLGVLYHFI